MASSSPRLTVLGGPLAGKELSIEDTVDNVLIGSDPSCRFCLPLPGISPIHARLWVDLQGLTVYDTNAPEGLYVNDDKVTGQASLRNGDILWLGTPGTEGVVMIQCRIPPRASVAAAQPAAPSALRPPDYDEEDEDAEEQAPTVSLPPPPAAPEEEAPETVVLATDAVLAAEAVPPPEPEPEEPEETIQVAPPAAEPEFVLTPGAARPQPVGPLEDDLDQTVATRASGSDENAYATPPPIPPPTPAEAGTLVLGGGDEPPWNAPAPPPIAATPAPFPPAMELPPVAPVFEEDIEEVVPATQVMAPPPAPPEPRLPPPPAPPPAPVRAAAAAPPPRPAPRPAARPPVVAAKPAPVVAAPAVKPAPAAALRPPKARSGGGAGLLIGLAAVVLLAVAGVAGWYFLLGPGAAHPSPSPSAPPPTLAQASPPASLATPEPAATATPEIPVEETTVVAPSPGPTPSPGAKPTPAVSPSPGKPSPSPKPSAAATAAGPDPAALRAQQVATLVGQAEQAAAEKRYDAAVALYDQALQLEPGNGQAIRGKSAAQSAASAASAAARRAFVAGRSVLVGAKTDKKLSGFESEDVAMAKAPDYSGRIDFEASPKSPRAGEGYSVRVYLLNDGKKDFKIASMTASTNASGEKSGGPMAPSTREVAPQQRALIQELSGVWKEGATAWSLEVAVQSSHGETVRNTLTWR